jgi:hypothetical protein
MKEIEKLSATQVLKLERLSDIKTGSFNQCTTPPPKEVLNVIHVDLSFYHAVTLLSSEMYKER